MINPWFTNALLDSCSLNPASPVEEIAIKEILCLHSDRGLSLVISHSTQREFDHPNTPQEVKEKSSSKIFTMQVGHNPQELVIKKKLRDLIVGNGKTSTYAADAEHIFEAQKCGSYFLTEDRRLLKKAAAVLSICGLVVLLPSDFLLLVKKHQAGEVAYQAWRRDCPASSSIRAA